MKKQFIINLKGKEFVLLAGLLDAFFENKGNEIITEELETSNKDMPKFKATVKGEKGIFTGHGDANNQNVNSMIANHKYRMAETRAIARALRLYNNIGMCSVEELGGDDVKIPEKNSGLEAHQEKINKITDIEDLKNYYIEHEGLGADFAKMITKRKLELNGNK